MAEQHGNVRGRVAVVTGASRGAGKGIALALARHGCTVYVTGRSKSREDAPLLNGKPLPGTIYDTAEEVTRAGGKGIAVVVDHGVESDIKALFDQVGREQGRLDILVNNAFPNDEEMTAPGNFWEKSPRLIDMLDVGVKGSYWASWYAAPLLVRQGGLVVFTSSSGASHYIFGPVYGAHKASIDKFAADMAVDFRESKVAALSIWMGSLLTERMKAMVEAEPDKYGHLLEIMETPELTGEVIWALYNDPELMGKSGRTLIGVEVAAEYGIRDRGDRLAPSTRDLYGAYPLPQFDMVIR